MTGVFIPSKLAKRTRGIVFAHRSMFGRARKGACSFLRGDRRRGFAVGAYPSSSSQQAGSSCEGRGQVLRTISSPTLTCF